ncbi:MAG TPA: M48 family metalloprotease [Candidatus Acidoferrales bacterium]|nr:M48 family metalloprotease [Candidatus Acidoferrales bacterium]
MNRANGWARKSLVSILSGLLILMPALSQAAYCKQQAPSTAPAKLPLRSYLDKSYLDIFTVAPELHFTAAEIKNQRMALTNGKAACVKRFKSHAKNYDNQINDAQKQLKQTTAKISEAERKDMHCRIQNLDLLKSEAQVLSQQAIPTAYDNLAAKLDIIENWPAAHALIEQQLASGAYNERRWGDIKDIGFRTIAVNPQDDIRVGEDAVRELHQKGLLPPELPDKAIQDYVNGVAQDIARHSDWKLPLHVTVLQSREVNAFALPGGYLFVERGLLEEADDESELAGVLAHEVSHDVARHSNKLMKRATVAGIFYQVAQIGAIVLTGGAAGIGLAYALQYGFYGLGMMIDLKLLGVSRDYELEADQLGVQYAWNAGYDPTGFTRFFDKMATHAGYVNSASWFRTHPPFYRRMVDAQREILFLPKKENLVVQTAAFEKMKTELAPIAAQADIEEVGKPSLLTREKGCAPPKKLEYKPGQPIEDLCATGLVISPAPKAAPKKQ